MMRRPHAVRVVRVLRRQMWAQLHAQTVWQALQTRTAHHPLHVQAAPAVSMLHRAPRPVLTVQLAQLTWTPVLRLPAVLVLPESTHLQDRRLAHSVLQVKLI